MAATQREGLGHHQGVLGGIAIEKVIEIEIEIGTKVANMETVTNGRINAKKRCLVMEVSMQSDGESLIGSHAA